VRKNGSIRKKSKVVPNISHKAVKVRRRARRLCASKKTFILIHKGHQEEIKSSS
jgi:hypothetical protein